MRPLRPVVVAAALAALPACNLILPGLEWPSRGFASWSARLGAPGADLTFPQVVGDPDGNVYVSGLFKGTVDFGRGAESSTGGDVASGFVVAWDTEGAVRWVVPVRAASGISNVRLSARAGEVVVSAGAAGKVEVGAFVHDAPVGTPGLLIARLRAQDGSVARADVWSTGKAIRGTAMLHPGGEVSVHGHFKGISLTVESTAVFNAATAVETDDLFAARLDATGRLRWLKRFGDAAAQSVYGAGTVDTGGNSVLLSSLSGSLAIDPCPAPAGATALIAKLDSDGRCTFALPFSPEGAGGASSLALWYAAPTGGLGTAVAGALFGTMRTGQQTVSSEGEADVVLARLDAFGTPLFVKRWGDASYNEVSGLAIDGSDNLYVASTSGRSIDFGGGTLTSAGDQDIFVARLDASGAHGWSRRFGDAREQVASSLSVDSRGRVLVAGHFAGTMDLGAGGMEAQGLHDVFIGRLEP